MISTTAFNRIMTAADRFDIANAADKHTLTVLAATAVIPAILIGVYVWLAVLDEMAFPREYRDASTWIGCGLAAFTTTIVASAVITIGLYYGVGEAPMKHACRRADTVLSKVYADHGRRLNMGQAAAIERFDTAVGVRCAHLL